MIRWTQRFGLRVRLSIVAALIGTLFATLVAYSALGKYRSSIRAMQQQAQIAARLLASEQRGLERSTRQLLEGLALATLPDGFRPLLGADCETTLRTILRANPVFIDVGVIDPDGAVACSVDPQAARLSVADRPYFREATATRAFVVSDPIVARSVRRTTVVAVQPLETVDGRLVGMLYAALDLAFLKDSMARQNLPEGTRMLILDEAGTALLRVPDPEGLAGNVILDHEAFAALVGRDEEGFGELRALSGKPRLVAYVPLRGTSPHRLFVWVGLPLDETRADALAAAVKDAVLYAAPIVVLLATMWWSLERIIIRPIDRLTVAAQRMGRGDLATRSNLGDAGTEIGELSASLDRLALSVQRSTRALRTLSGGNQALLHATAESDLLQSMCDVAVQEGRYRTACIYFAGGRERSDRVRLVAQAGTQVSSHDADFARSPGDDDPFRDGIRETLARGQAAVVHLSGVAATDGSAGPRADDGARASVFSAPLRFEQDVIGTLTLVSDDPGAFDEDGAALLTEMSDDVSYGITNMRVRATLAAGAQRATRARLALSAGNRAVAEGLDETALLARICQIAVEHGGYLLAYVTYIDPAYADGYRVVARHGGSAATDIALDDGPLTDVGQRALATISSGVDAAVLDDLRSMALPDTWKRAEGDLPIRAALTLPLREHQALIGAVTFLSSYDPAFGSAERELLGELALDISIGITTNRGRERQKEAEAALERAATHDAATGLPTQPAMITRLEAAVAEAAAGAESLTVLAVYFSRLETLYHGMGYALGNRVANVIAARLTRISRLNAIVGRTRNDEFVTFLPDSDAGRSATVVAEIQRLFEDSIEVEGAPFDMPPSTGASFFPGHGDDADLLLRKASLAAREAARRGAEHVVYDRSLQTDNPARLKLAGELRGAIDRRELTLHFQPKVSLATNRICGAEALVRWQHDVHGLVLPGEFVPIAEQTGQIRELTYLVLELAVRQLSTWSKVGLSMPIAVNLSARDLQNPHLTERVEGLLATWGVPAALLHFEVTETALLEDPDAAKTRLEYLRDLGSQIFIDDFGTGYSSLNYLVALPVHALKIDRSFVVQMATRPEAATVVASVISMAHGLGMKFVAEGVESGDERDRLARMHCDEIQGYFVGGPMAAVDFLAFVREHAG